jgi:hypothetical protein
MHRKSNLAAVALIAILAGTMSASADNSGGGGGGSSGSGDDTPSAASFFAQNTTRGTLRTIGDKTEEKERELKQINNGGRVTPAATGGGQTTARPKPAPSTKARSGPPPIPANEASNTVRLVNGDTLFARPNGLFSFYQPTYPPGRDPKVEGWTKKHDMANGWTVYSGWADGFVVVIDPYGKRYMRYSR